MEQETREKWRIRWRQAELGFSSGLTDSCWHCKVQGGRGCGRHSHVCLQNLRIRGHRLGQAVTPVLRPPVSQASSRTLTIKCTVS